jgi:uncharacterized protein with FMN-binding domain
MTTLRKRISATAMAGISASLVVASCATADPVGVRPTLVPDTAVTRPASAASKASAYADGVHTATGQYGGLPSSITVTVTLAGDVITAVDVTPHATDPTSLDFQRRFAAAVPTVVVGKRIDEVRVDRLAGSSGTPDGFNAAIQRIQQQARTGTTPSR